MRPGAYQRADAKNAQLEGDRWLFLILARQCDLRIMIDLSIGPAQRYQELIAFHAYRHCNGKMTWEQFLAFMPDWKTVSLESGCVAFRSPIQALRKALLDWSVKWHLDADWCRDRAIAAMRLWGWSKRAQLYLCWDALDLWVSIQERLKIIDQLSNDEREQLCSWESDPAFRIDTRSAAARSSGTLPPGVEGRRRIYPDFFDPLFPQPPGNLPAYPSLETRKVYCERVRKNAEEEFAHVSKAERRRNVNSRLRIAKRYLDQIDRWYKNSGWEPVRPQPNHLMRLQWAARYQIVGSERSQIAATAPMVQKDTVSHAISKVLAHLGLPSRRRRRPMRGNV